MKMIIDCRTSFVEDCVCLIKLIYSPEIMLKLKQFQFKLDFFYFLLFLDIIKKGFLKMKITKIQKRK